MKFDTLYYPYASRRNLVYGHRGMVASSHPLATQAGLHILHEGGNAVDAAVAIAYILSVEIFITILILAINLVFTIKFATIYIICVVTKVARVFPANQIARRNFVIFSVFNHFMASTSRFVNKFFSAV